MDPIVTLLPSPPSHTRRAMALVRHRLSAAAGFGILIVTVSSILLPHRGETLCTLNPTISTRDAGSGQDSLPQAVETVKNAHPDEPVLLTRWDTDAVEIRIERVTYTINPATGHETGRASATLVRISVLGSLHRYLLFCRGPGHVNWMSQEIPHIGRRHGHRGLAAGGLVVAILGVVLTVLTVNGLRTWWPLQRYRHIALFARRRTQRLSRDTNLLRVAGLVLLPLLFLRGYYASAFGIHPTQPAAPVSMTARQSPAGSANTGPTQDVGPYCVVAAARKAGGGRVVALFLSQPNDSSSTCTAWVTHGERLAPRQSPDDTAVSTTMNVDPGTGQTTLPSTPGHRPTTRTDQRL